jgi:hypothetical protein
LREGKLQRAGIACGVPQRNTKLPLRDLHRAFVWDLDDASLVGEMRQSKKMTS